MTVINLKLHYNGDYRKARDEMKELLTVKANVDRLMGYDEKSAEQEKEKSPAR